MCLYVMQLQGMLYSECFLTSHAFELLLSFWNVLQYNVTFHIRFLRTLQTTELARKDLFFPVSRDCIVPMKSSGFLWNRGSTAGTCDAFTDKGGSFLITLAGLGFLTEPLPGLLMLLFDSTDFKAPPLNGRKSSKDFFVSKNC